MNPFAGCGHFWGSGMRNVNSHIAFRMCFLKITSSNLWRFSLRKYIALRSGKKYKLAMIRTSKASQCSRSSSGNHFSWTASFKKIFHFPFPQKKRMKTSRAQEISFSFLLLTTFVVLSQPRLAMSSPILTGSSSTPASVTLANVNSTSSANTLTVVHAEDSDSKVTVLNASEDLWCHARSFTKAILARLPQKVSFVLVPGK